LSRRVQAGYSKETPEQLNTPGKRALWNNVGQDEVLALKIDAVVREVRPDGWRGISPREKTIKAALYETLKDEAEVERIFLVIKAQREY
jgi:type I restriction enzyme R subunit